VPFLLAFLLLQAKSMQSNFGVLKDAVFFDLWIPGFRTPKKDPVLWAWFETFFTPKRYQF